MAEKTGRDLSVGEMADRAGVAVSTLHFYEAEGLIKSWRTGANHRRYNRAELRRVAIAKTAQKVGVPLADVKAMLDQIPRDKAVSAADWRQAGEQWSDLLLDQIINLRRLRSQLHGCIGCGCLSVEQCALFNEDDQLAKNGAGPRRWVGEEDELAPMRRPG